MDFEKKKKKKRKVSYNIFIVPDVAYDKIQNFKLSQTVLTVLFVFILFIICSEIVGGVYAFKRIQGEKRNVQQLTEQVASIEEMNTELETENKELMEKVSILSDTVNDQEAARKDLDEKYMPTGFPLKGTAAYSEDIQDEQGRQMIVFTTNEGTEVMAAGGGEVKEITSDEKYGYCIVIEHTNGYVSYYRDFSTPRVAVGDEVTRSTVLFRIEAGGENLGYQISKDGSFIDPMEIMEIYG